MTVPLPSALPTSSGWALADKIDRSFTSAPAGASGVATIDVGPLDTATRWVLTHMVAACTSGSASVMRLYFGTAGSPAAFRDGSDRGNFDVADWPAGLLVPEGTDLVAQWSGATPGAVATLTLQADVYRRT